MKVQALKKEFLSAIEYELARCNRYGGPFSIILLETVGLLDNQNKEDALVLSEKSVTAATGLIKEKIRRTDRLFVLTPQLFGIILPCTPEAGAESVALRLKKGLAAELSDTSGLPLASHAGSFSCYGKTGITTTKIYEYLIRGVERERYIQTCFVEPVPETVRRDVGHVVILTDKREKYKKISSEIEGDGYISYITDNPEDALGILLERSYTVLVADLDTKYNKTLKNIAGRINEQKVRGEYFILGIGSVDASLCDTLIPGDPEEGIIAGHLKKNVECLILKRQAVICRQMERALVEIRAMAHQAGQPLQVILGNAELLSMKLSRDVLSTEEIVQFKKDVENIRTSVFAISDINMKISRLAKLQENQK